MANLSSILCPICGHSFDGLQEMEKFSDHMIADIPILWAQQEDIAVAEAEVHHLEGFISRFHQRRARLLRRINSTQATTRCLPPEVLSTIFQFARPPIDFDTRLTPSDFPEDPRSRRDTYKEEDDFQLVLGAVSYHWRQVAWTTSHLWTTVSVEVHETTCESNMSLLNLYFENVQGCAMTVELDFRIQLMCLLDPEMDLSGREESIFLIESLNASVLNHAAKIQNLIITGLPFEFISLVDKSFSQCESMTLFWPPTYTSKLVNDRGHGPLTPLHLAELSNLSHFRVKGLHLPFELQWSMITTLQLCGVPISQCIESLVKCPNLVKFESLEYVPRDSLPSLSQTIVLEHLESLTWYSCDDAWSCAFLHHVRFNKLRILKWSGHLSEEESSEEFHGSFTTFFSDLPETFEVLELVGASYGFRCMKVLLTSIPHLTKFVLNGCANITLSMAVSMIGRPAQWLIEDPVEERALAVNPDLSRGLKALPHLMKLTIVNSDANPKPEMVAEMLEALHTARTTPECFRLELMPMNAIWGLELLVRLQRLARSGFEFEILLGPRTLDIVGNILSLLQTIRLGIEDNTITTRYA